MDKYCKGTKRPAEQYLPENPKHPLVDYGSSESEPEESPEPGPWRATAESSSEEETVPVESEEEPLHTEPKESWRTAAVESSSEEDTCAESSDEEPWDVEEEPTAPPHAETEEPIVEEVPPHIPTRTEEEEIEEPEELNLNTLKKALPWTTYQGMGVEQFSVATQQMGGNPLFQFEFSPISEQQWMRRVQKTIYHTRLRQRRPPRDTDDVGVAIVNAMEESTRQHLTKIGAREEDRVFLAITAHEFNHIYQTTEFTVQEFMAGSTRLD